MRQNNWDVKEPLMAEDSRKNTFYEADEYNSSAFFQQPRRTSVVSHY